MFILPVSTLQCWLLQLFFPIRQNFKTFSQVTSSELGLALVPALTRIYRAVLSPAHKESISEISHHMWHLLLLFCLMFGHPLVLMGNRESNSSHAQSRSARALQVWCARTKDAGFGTGGFKKKIVRYRVSECFGWGIPSMPVSFIFLILVTCLLGVQDLFPKGLSCFLWRCQLTWAKK